MALQHDKSRTKPANSPVLALACGATVERAARQSGVSPRTVYRRLADPAFRKEVHDLRVEMLQRSAATLTAAASEAIKTLLTLQQPAEAGAVRLGAAKAILEIGMKLREMVDIEARLMELE